MVRLSVNVNKIATLRNARGGNVPDVVEVAKDCERFGAQGITVHPRPDERHIRYDDVMRLAEVITTEFNIEGYPDKRFIEIIEKARPTQATLVPDAPDALTSDAGWDVVRHRTLLRESIDAIRSLGARVSLFVEPSVSAVQDAAQVGADRIELFTGPYASRYDDGRKEAVKPYIEAAAAAHEAGMAVNAGHDLNRYNLAFFAKRVRPLDEVSIGHALVCEALYLGLENTIQMYRRQLA